MTSWYRAMDGKTRRVFWTCSFGWAMDTADGLVFQYLIPVLVAGLGITLAQASMITSANYIAAALGGWLGGWLCDRFGRARILQFTIAWFSFFSFVSGFAHNFHELLAARLLQGIGFGAEWAVGAVLLGEMLNPKDRGKVLGVVHSGAAIGSGIAALMAGPVASAFPPEYGWRIVFWVGSLPAILIFFIRRGSDDSEVFKAARVASRAVGRKVSLATIFTPRLLPITVFAALLAVGGQGAGFAVSNYLTTFLHNERGLSTSVAGYCVLFNSAGGFFGFVTNAYLSDRLGRRTIFRLFGLGFIITSSIYLFGPWGANLALLIPLGLIYGFFQFGIYASFGPYFTELFPTEVRGTGQAFCYNFGRATSGLFFIGVGALTARMALSAAMATMAIGAIVLAVIATLFLPETAGRELRGMDEPADRVALEEVPAGA